MPVEFGIWKITNGVEKVQWSSIDREARIEEILVKDVSIIGLDLLLIGRQVLTDFGKKLDLLAIDREGSLVVIEIKRDRTPRDVVAQLLDYGSWVEKVTYETILETFKAFTGKDFESAFVERFGGSLPEAINESHRLIVVATELDTSTERIVTYLSSSFDVPINTLFFRYFKDGQEEYIARTWLVDPHIAEIRSESSRASKGSKEPWNGQDFYVSLGEGVHRNWEDCIKYGFISGGQGRWYSRTLEQLFPGARVFVHVPEKGYVGVGIVKGGTTPIKKFDVEANGKKIPLLSAKVLAPQMNENSDDPEKSEYAVAIDWIKTVPIEKAIWQKGFFANQNTVCKLRNRFTLEKLTTLFGLED